MRPNPVKRISIFSFFLFLTFLTVYSAEAAVSLTTGKDPFGNNCDIVSWNDVSRQPRTVWIVTGSPGGFITRYTYYAGSTLVDARAAENYPPFAFCGLVNHWHPDNSGYFSDSWSTSFYTQPFSKTYTFTGTNHLVWRGTMRLQIDTNPSDANTASYYNTVQLIFENGRNDFIFSSAYDCSDMPESNMWSDNRGPYGDFDFDGNGSSNESISGIGWGTLYKFKTTGSTLSINSGWDYTQPNTIPYIWEWKDTTLNDRELGIVQNQPYKDQNAGFEAHNSTTAITAPPSSGTGLPTSANYYAGLAFQLNCYANYTGERFTWGTNYQNTWGLFGGKGVFQEGHGEAFGKYTYGKTQNGFEQYPINAWSFSVLVDQWSANGLPALVSDTENIYAATLTAATGTVVTTGPRGPGNFVSPSVGTMPTVTYTQPGFDYVTRAWTLQASGGTVDCTLAVPTGKTVSRPTFILKGMTAAPCGVQLNGTTQTEGADMFSSFDSATSQVYITFNKDFAAGSNHLVVQTNCGPTATGTFTGTSTSTNTPTSTNTNTPLPPTNTFTSTVTSTLTNSPTFTFSRTFTPTSTYTNTPVPPTNTYTFTFTSTFTATSSFTSAHTPTRTPTPSFTPTFSPTITFTPTNTGTPTPTPTGTYFMATFTSSFTPTDSPTSTFTLTLTSTPTATLTTSPTDTNTATFSATRTFTSSSTTTGTPTGTSTSTATATNSFTAFFTLSFTPTDSATPTSTSSLTLTVSPTPISTSTFTSSFTASPTPSFTPTATTTRTWTPTATSTFSTTSTATILSPLKGGIVLIYPNPTDGKKPVFVRVPDLNQTTDIRVEIFTLAFRKVQSRQYLQILAGVDPQVELIDRDGAPLANGIYYVVVWVEGKRFIGKLLLIR